MRGGFAAKQALFAARGGARTPLRATETRALLRAIFFFLSGLFERRGRRSQRQKFRQKRREKPIFFLKERERKDTGLYKKRRTLFFRAVLFE